MYDIVECFTAHPAILILTKTIVVANPSEFNLVLESWLLGTRVFEDSEFEPRPNSSEFIVAGTLVMELRK